MMRSPMLRMKRTVLATLLLGTTLPQATASPVLAQQPVPDRFDGVRATIESVMSERNLASISVAAAQDGRVVWEEAFGWADREARIEATPHTPYSLASISKPILATGLMVLVERGAVDLDRPVDEYLGDARLSGLGGDPAQATVRRVLSHTAGLPLHYQFFYEDGGYEPPPRSETIRRYGIVAHPPGTEFLYSNVGYGIIDHVVSSASGRPYDEFLRSEVFLPLGMTRTSAGLPDVLKPYAAVRYGPENRRVPYYDFDHPGASTVWASAHDLVRFGLFHLGHVPEDARRVLAPQTVADMHRRETPEEGAGYGLGWFMADEMGFEKQWHTGSMPGVSTMLALYPEMDIAVVVLLNNLATDLRVSIAQEIVAALDEGYAETLEAARAEAERAEAARAEAAERAAAAAPGAATGIGGSFVPPAALMGEWVGTLRTWVGEIPMAIAVGENGDVHVAVEGRLDAVLNGVGFDDGRLRGRYAGRIPTPDVMRHPLHSVALDLRLEGDRLYGQASAQTEANPTFYSLASFVDLTRRR